MTEPTRSSSYRFGTFELQPNERRLLAGGEPVVLGPRAFDLLVALVERPGQLVTKEELLDCVWPNLVVEENNLQVQVSALRKILVQEATDSHLWSETYDRELEDIFAVQDEIAQSVVKELRSALLGEKADSPASAAVKAEVQAATKGRGENAEAYRLYLQGRSLVTRRTQASVATGIEHFRQAVSLDPEYALAWAALAHAQTIEAGTGGWTPYEEGYRRARKAAERALALEPDLAEGHIALGLVRMGYDWIGQVRKRRCGGRWSWRQVMRMSFSPRRWRPGMLATLMNRSRFAGEQLRLIGSTCTATAISDCFLCSPVFWSRRKRR